MNKKWILLGALVAILAGVVAILSIPEHNATGAPTANYVPPTNFAPGFSVLDPRFNAKGDLRLASDMAITSGQATLSSTQLALAAADAGKQICVIGAGAAGAPLTTTVLSVSGGVATLSANAGTTVSGAQGYCGTDDSAAFAAAETAAAAIGSLLPELQSVDLTPRFKGGVVVRVPTGAYLIGPQTLSGRVAIEGDGWGTVLWLKAKSNAPVVTNALHANQCSVRNLRIDGFKAGQTAVARTVADAGMTNGSNVLTSATLAFAAADAGTPVSVVGAGASGGNVNAFISGYTDATHVILDTNANTTVTNASCTVGTKCYGVSWFSPLLPAYDRTLDEDYDFNGHCEHVHVHNTKDDGFACIGRGDTVLHGCKTHYCDGNGFLVYQDVFLDGCNAGVSGLFGFRILGGGVKGFGCKAWMSGRITPGSGDGLRLENLVQGTFVGCEAQDNARAGISLVGCVGVTFTGVMCDSNNTGVHIAGVDIYNCTNCEVTGSSIDNARAAFANRQDTALKIAATSLGNRVYLASKGNIANTQSNPHVSTFSDSVAGNDIRINASGSGQQVVAYAASITPDATKGETVNVGTLTGAITINAPLYPWTGQRLRFVLTQDGTGGRVATFNAVFKTNWTPSTAVSKANTIEFENDGTNWNQVAAVTGL